MKATSSIRFAVALTAVAASLTFTELPASAGAPPGTTAAAPSNPCSVRLAEAWQTLGHFSDAYEIYLLGQPPCASTDRTTGASKDARAALAHLSSMTRTTRGRVFRLDGAYSGGAALTAAISVG